MNHRSFVAAASALLICVSPMQLMTTAKAAEVSTEAGAGGLSFAAHPSIKIDQQDVLISPDKIAVTYTIRNEASSPQSIYISFALPDVDANAIAEGELALASTEALNFVQFATMVDGQPLAVETEQRAAALGLDVTNLLAASGIPTLPTADGLPAKLDALTQAQRLELLERGIFKEDGATIAPAWSVKTVAYWRQSFAPGQTLTIQHSYRPIAGISHYQVDANSALRKRMCFTAAHETAIAKLASTAGIAPTLTSITYAATANADALGPVRRFRLIVESGDAQTVIATCREGLKQTSPIQRDWNATDYIPDEEFQLLFAR